jgi:hypothetical protein
MTASKLTPDFWSTVCQPRSRAMTSLGKLATHHRPRFPGLLIAAISITQLFDHKPTSRPALVQDGLDTNVDTLH